MKTLIRLCTRVSLNHCLRTTLLLQAQTWLPSAVSVAFPKSLLLLPSLPPPPTPFQVILFIFVTNSCALFLSQQDFLGLNEAISKLNLYMLPKKLKFTQNSNEVCRISV